MTNNDSSEDVPQTLRNVRRKLMADAAFSKNVQRLRAPVSGRDFAVSFGSLLLGLALQVGAMSQGLWWLSPIGLTFQLAGIVGCSSVQHEAWHQRALSNRQANKFVAEWILSPLFMNDFNMSARAHMSHHRYMGEDRDPDRASWYPSWGAFWIAQLKRWMIIPAAISVLRGLGSGGRVAKRSDNEQSGVPTATYVRIAIFHAIWIVIAVSAGWIGFFVAYLMPMLVGQTLVSIRGQREHVYLPDGRLRSFETVCPVYERVFIGGGYFNLHAVHHVFPEIPQRQQPELVSLIMGNENWKAIYLSTPLIVSRPSYFSARPWQD